MVSRPYFFHNTTPYRIDPHRPVELSTTQAGYRSICIHHFPSMIDPLELRPYYTRVD